MTESKPSLPWPGADDRLVVEAMLVDSMSAHWNECYKFVKGLVQVEAKNIPVDYCEDIAQEAILQISKSLPTFKYQCSLRIWLLAIVNSCIIEAYGKLKQNRQSINLLFYDLDYEGSEEVASPTNTPETVEDESTVHLELYQALAALQEYVSTHAHSTRNGQILDMVLLEGCSLEEAARAVGCSAPVASYVVRSAQRYVRERLGYQVSKLPLTSDLSSAYREQGKTYEQLAEQTFENLKRSAQESYTIAKELGVE